jgi:hypothetical protein
MNCRHFIFTLVGVVFMQGPAQADDSPLPGSGWPIARYESLWAKSPFAVASPEGAPPSMTYALWGIAEIDGVSYASLTDKATSEHFLLSSEKPNRGLTLVSIKRGSDSSDMSAVILKDGQQETLKLEQAPPPQPISNVGPAAAAAMTPPGPNGIPNSPNINPGVVNGLNRFPGSTPPPVVRRQHIIHVPPNPAQQPGINQTPPSK